MARATPLNVLIVEDSEDDALLLVHHLRGGGFEPKFERVETADGMRAALGAKTWDAIISDYNLPEFSPAAGVGLMRAADLDLPFIIVSGTIGEERAADLMRAGAHDLILKDNLARLIPALTRELSEAENRRKRKQAEEALNKQTRSFRLLQKVAVAANEASGVDEAIQGFLDEICAHTGWPVGHAYRPSDDDTGKLVPTTIWHLDDPGKFDTFRRVTEETRFAPGIGLPGRVMQNGEPAWIVDVTRDRNFPRAKLAKEIGVKAGFAFPVFVDEEVVAVLEFFSADAVEPDPVLLEVMVHVGTQLGRAIERGKARARLEESEALLRSIAANLPGAIYRRLHKPDGTWRYEFISEGYADIVGRSVAEIMANPSVVQDIVHPEDYDSLVKAVNQSVERLEGIDVEYRVVCPGGTVKWLRAIAQSRRLDNGDVVADGVTLDITTHKRAEEALRASEQRYRDFFEHAPLAIWEEDYSAVKRMIDELRDEGVQDFHRYFEDHPETPRDMVAAIKFLDVNRATLDIYGAANKEEFIRAVSDSPGRLVPEEFHRQELAALASGDTRFESEDVVQAFDGSEKVVRSITHIDEAYKDSWARVVTTEEDVTGRKQAEAQLRQAQKMEAVGNLTGGIAHDFNNLLTVILGNLQLLERNVKSDEKLYKRVRTASDAVLRGAELTKRLLAFSRRQALDSRSVDLNVLVRGMDNLLRRTLGEAIEIKTIIDKDLWPAHVDPGQLENTLLNLAINARDAMPEGGKLTIETANVTLDEAYAAQHSYVSPGDYVMLATTDTGVGMPEEVLDHVFEPFFTTKEAGLGSGLGLSMVYGFVKQSAGHVNIYSEEDHGTSVKIYLPKSDSDAAASKDKVAGDDEMPTGDETVLVVEDDAGVRETAVLLLEEFGYRVIEAEDGPTALAALDQHPDVDLLFTDVIMPGGMNGAELARKVLDLRPDIKVLYASGYTENAIAHGGILDESVELIGKPYLKEDLARRIRRVLDS